MTCAIRSRVSRYAPGRGEPERHARHQQHGEGEEGDRGRARVEHHQDHRGADERQRGREERRDALGHELVERLDVVGQARDQHARPVARVEADRQALEMLEQLDPEVLQRPLAHPVDEVGLQVGGDPVHRRPRQRTRSRSSSARSCPSALMPSSIARPARYGGASAAAVEIKECDEHQQHAPAVRAQQADRGGAGGRRGSQPATSRSGSSRVRNTWSGRPFSAISR